MVGWRGCLILIQANVQYPMSLLLQALSKQLWALEKENKSPSLFVSPLLSYIAAVIDFGDGYTSTAIIVEPSSEPSMLETTL